MVVRPVVDKEFVSLSCLERECVAIDERSSVIIAFVGLPGHISCEHYSVSAAAGSVSIEIVSRIGVRLKSRSSYGQIRFLDFDRAADFTGNGGILYGKNVFLAFGIV